jgi:hypothetical protein
MKTTEEAWRGGGAPRNNVRLRRALRLVEEYGVRTGAANRGWRASGQLSSVEAVGGVAWMKSGVEEGLRRPGTGSTSSLECRGALGLVVGCSREKEWRGWSAPFYGRAGLRKKIGGDGGGPVRAAPRGGRRREDPGSVTPCGGGRCGEPGAGRGARPAGAGGSRPARARQETEWISSVWTIEINNF